MKKNRLKQIIAISVFLLIISPSLLVHAKVQSFSSLNMELTVPDDAILLTKDTPNSDTQWLKAGIMDPKNEKESFDKMGALALIFDPNTSTSVHLLQKQSKKSQEIFNLNLLNATELQDFFDTLFTKEDDSVTYTIEEYSQQEVPFFRMSLLIDTDSKPMTELIYGTIVNGYTISYDIYKEGTQALPDETFIKELVSNTHFTSFLDKAEVERQARNATILLVVLLLSIIIIITIWVLISKRRRKKKDILKKQKTQKLAQFFSDQRKREEQNEKDISIMENHTLYSEDIIKQFCTYDRFLYHLRVWIITAVLYIVLIGTLYITGSILGLFISVVVLIVFMYFQGFQLEKTITRMKKAYESNKSMEAIFTFYETYYTLTGIQSNSKYPYIQITDIKEYKDFIYIYLGENKAHFLKKNGFDKDLDEFKRFIKEHTK